MIPRRRMLETVAAGAAGLSLSRALRAFAAAALPLTPAQTAGPFYPLTLPADSDNDLVHIAGRAGTAKGTVTYVTGRVLDPTGRPISGARVEIWQCDANGRYHYVRDDRAGPPLDENFQGYGQTMTDAAGGYDFRIPVLDARALSDAADGQVELRILAGAGHRLRSDPRAIALLIGWLDRQHR